MCVVRAVTEDNTFDSALHVTCATVLLSSRLCGHDIALFPLTSLQRRARDTRQRPRLTTFHDQLQQRRRLWTGLRQRHRPCSICRDNIQPCAQVVHATKCQRGGVRERSWRADRQGIVTLPPAESQIISIIKCRLAQHQSTFPGEGIMYATVAGRTELCIVSLRGKLAVDPLR